MADTSKSVEKLIVDLYESTQREMQAGFQALDRRLGAIEGVLKTHRGMMLAGTVAYQTLTEGLAGVQGREPQLEKELRELRARVQKLEKRR